MKPITVYTTDYCPYCREAERFLREKGLPFTNIDVTHDQTMREQLVERSGQRTVPQIFVGETSVGGYSDMIAMHRRGEFEPLVAG